MEFNNKQLIETNHNDYYVIVVTDEQGLDRYILSINHPKNISKYVKHTNVLSKARPFKNQHAANKFVDRYNNQLINPRICKVVRESYVLNAIPLSTYQSTITPGVRIKHGFLDQGEVHTF